MVAAGKNLELLSDYRHKETIPKLESFSQRSFTPLHFWLSRPGVLSALFSSFSFRFIAGAVLCLLLFFQSLSSLNTMVFLRPAFIAALISTSIFRSCCYAARFKAVTGLTATKKAMDKMSLLATQDAAAAASPISDVNTSLQSAQDGQAIAAEAGTKVSDGFQAVKAALDSIKATNSSSPFGYALRQVITQIEDAIKAGTEVGTSCGGGGAGSSASASASNMASASNTIAQSSIASSVASTSASTKNNASASTSASGSASASTFASASSSASATAQASATDKSANSASDTTSVKVTSTGSSSGSGSGSGSNTITVTETVTVTSKGASQATSSNAASASQANSSKASGATSSASASQAASSSGLDATSAASGSHASQATS
ncbi:hypothetical protein D9758_007909 [Tetrapyrgos nigripes]|uniref:Uncharacterized protein n=1 Tax=Tetrapyrgos nigripes TaxID=182062 RepID=A0A8H5D672_9AGAR|nr:hypothetical protein D9758_007909 [Tetrapyrgos nigripes]